MISRFSRLYLCTVFSPSHLSDIWVSQISLAFLTCHKSVSLCLPCHSCRTCARGMSHHPCAQSYGSFSSHHRNALSCKVSLKNMDGHHVSLFCTDARRHGQSHGAQCVCHHACRRCVSRRHADFLILCSPFFPCCKVSLTFLQPFWPVSLTCPNPLRTSSPARSNPMRANHHQMPSSNS